MKLIIDTEAKTLTEEDSGSSKIHQLYSKEAFEALNRQWIRVGWNQKVQYTYSWMGRPIIQLPDDMVRTQEAIFQIQPDVIVETGVAHGGSLIYYSSLCRVLGKGRIIGVDIEIRPHNRKAIEEHPLSDRIHLIEGSSTSDEVLREVRSLIKPGETVLVILDSNHTYAHVLEELRLYAPLVTRGSYIVATDGIMFDLADVPRGKPEWTKDNPTQAALDFAAANTSFVIEQPAWPFNESDLQHNITHWPSAWLKRVD